MILLHLLIWSYIFSFLLVNMMNYANWFQMLKQYCILEYLNWSWCILLFIYCWDWFANIFWGIFPSMFMIINLYNQVCIRQTGSFHFSECLCLFFFLGVTFASLNQLRESPALSSGRYCRELINVWSDSLANSSESGAFYLEGYHLLIPFLS